jgi:hypothetical protein
VSTPTAPDPSEQIHVIDYQVGSAVFGRCGTIRELAPGQSWRDAGFTEDRYQATCTKGCLHPSTDRR